MIWPSPFGLLCLRVLHLKCFGEKGSTFERDKLPSSSLGLSLKKKVVLIKGIVNNLFLFSEGAVSVLMWALSCSANSSLFSKKTNFTTSARRRIKMTIWSALTVTHLEGNCWKVFKSLERGVTHFIIYSCKAASSVRFKDMCCSATRGLIFSTSSSLKGHRLKFKSHKMRNSFALSLSSKWQVKKNSSIITHW